MTLLFTFLAQTIAGLYQAKVEADQTVRQREQWFKLSLSLAGTSFVTFWGTWGAAGMSLLASGQAPAAALIGGFFVAALATAAAVLALWKRSALTRGIAILASMRVEEEVLKGNVAITTPAEPAGNSKLEIRNSDQFPVSNFQIPNKEDETWPHGELHYSGC